METRKEITDVEIIHPNRQFWRDILAGKGVDKDGKTRVRYQDERLQRLGQDILQVANVQDQSQWPEWIKSYVNGGVPLEELIVDLIAELKERVKVRPLINSVVKVKELNQQVPIDELFKRDCVSAGYNIFQLADVQMIRDAGGKLRLSRPPIFWAKADSWAPVNDFLQRNVGYQVLYNIKDRKSKLNDLQRQENALKTDPRRCHVGNSIVVLADGKDNRTLLIIFGAISAELAGSWKGGRTNTTNSVIFKLERQGAIDKFLAEINIRARVYEDGTEQNYRVIKEVMDGVFPKEAMKFVESHMFHRQEIQEVVDLRKSK